MVPAFWLAVCIAWAVLGAVFIPRLLSGDVMVYVTQRATTSRAGVLLVPLEPVSGNFTQAVYALGNLAVFVSAARLASLPSGLLQLRDAMRALAMLLLLSAGLNLAETYLGAPSLLTWVRNGGYAVMVGGDVGGLQRVTGTFPEASAFASYTLPVFAFAFALRLQGDPARWLVWAVPALAIVILITTSTTGYVAMALYLGGVALLHAHRVMSPTARRLWRWAVITAFVVALAVLLVLALHPGALAKLSRFFDIVLGQKLVSSSGEERMRWNLQGIRNLLDTRGLGVGLGSARTSSFFVLLLSNLGLIGTAAYLLFARAVLVAPWRATGNDEALRVRTAFRHAFAASLCAAAVSGTVFERGPAFYIYAAAASVTGVALWAVAGARSGRRRGEPPRSLTGEAPPARYA